MGISSRHRTKHLPKVYKSEEPELELKAKEVRDDGHLSLIF